MFRFWSTDSKGSEKTFEGSHSLSSDHPESLSHSTVPNVPELPKPSTLKRRRPSFVDTTSYFDGYQSAKRIKVAQNGGLPSPTSAIADGDEDERMLHKSSMALDLDRAKDVIQYQFGLEILLKHDELRLINQELAKCQVALEQLRRCHLMPYPVQCPTPSQMLEISSGKGPALRSVSGHSVPKWAPPFGVVEGPYARHYAKWLIPDPVFDGMQPSVQGVAETTRVKNVAAEGRTTRNSMPDLGVSGKQRPARGQAGQKLQALSSGYPQHKDKQAPCILKRSDGVTVKLVCIDCKRWDFSSTQGFINHCRIAHRRDFKSHEEAAVQSGHPIEVGEAGPMVSDEHKSPPAPGSVLVHPLARNDPVTDQQAYKALLSRINASLELYHSGKLPNVSRIPTSLAPQPSNLVGSSDAPHLSRLMQKKKMAGNLDEQVNDAKTKVDWDILLLGDDSDDIDQPGAGASDGPARYQKPLPSAARIPAVMRVPARSAASPTPPTSTTRPASSKGRVPTHLGLVPSADVVSPDLPETPIYDDEIDVDLSPNTVTSNNAPSLVSDDGEYDDSDDGSASDTSDELETESVSDVAEINIEEDSDAQSGTPRPIHRRESTTTAAKLKKDEARHVTFVTAIPNNNAPVRRKQKA